jgi:hypothetical protein
MKPPPIRPCVFHEATYSSSELVEHSPLSILDSVDNSISRSRRSIEFASRLVRERDRPARDLHAPFTSCAPRDYSARRAGYVSAARLGGDGAEKLPSTLPGLTGQFTITTRTVSTSSDAKAPTIKPTSGLRLRLSVFSDRVTISGNREISGSDLCLESDTNGGYPQGRSQNYSSGASPTARTAVNLNFRG